MIKRKNMCMLFAALTILSLATIILPGCDCFDQPRVRYIYIWENGTAELHDVPRDGGCLGYYHIPISPEEVANYQSQGVPIHFRNDQARRSWEARGYSGRGGGTDEQQVEQLPPLEIAPDGLPSNTIELGPSGGGKEAGGVRGGGGGGKP